DLMHDAPAHDHDASLYLISHLPPNIPNEFFKWITAGSQSHNGPLKVITRSHHWHVLLEQIKGMLINLGSFHAILEFMLNMSNNPFNDFLRSPGSFERIHQFFRLEIFSAAIRFHDSIQFF